MPLKKSIFDISRGSLHDGRGIRTVVYLKGCTMRCLWCHNPEGLSPEPQIMLSLTRCVSCGLCASVCGCHVVTKDAHIFDRQKCIVCGKCAEVCPTNALELCGREMSADEIMNEILKDRHYYVSSSGGVTFSGGECLMKREFMTDMLGSCSDKKISVTIETSLKVPWGNIEAAIPFTEAFYADIKHMDSRMHEKYTGCGNGLLLCNFVKLCKIHDNVTVRIPLIPGVNDDTENLIRTARFAKENGAAGVELLKYNPFGDAKYIRIGQQFRSFAADPQENSVMESICLELNKAVGTEDYVFFAK